MITHGGLISRVTVHARMYVVHPFGGSTPHGGIDSDRELVRKKELFCHIDHVHLHHNSTTDPS